MNSIKENMQSQEKVVLLEHRHMLSPEVIEGGLIEMQGMWRSVGALINWDYPTIYIYTK